MFQDKHSIFGSDRGEQDEMSIVKSENKIFIFLFLESRKNQERLFQILLKRSRIKNKLSNFKILFLIEKARNTVQDFR